MAKINYAKLYTQRADGCYQGKYKDASGKWKTVCSKDPEKLYHKIQELEKPTIITFGMVAADWENVHREEVGEKTWYNYKPHVDSIVKKHGKRPVEEITALDVINDLKCAQGEGRSATIISTRRSIYRMILDHALMNGHIKYNPAIGVSMPRGITRNRREAPEEEAIKTILQSPHVPFGLFPILLLCSGLRKAEALALTWGDITEDYINVNKALDYMYHAKPTVKSPKTKAGYRQVPIISTLKPLLQRPKHARDGDLVFPAPSSNRGGLGGGHMTERQYEGAWNRYCTEIGLVDANGKPTITAHQLRHGTATMLYDAGVDILTAQAILGHASPTTTRDIYTHLSSKQKQKSVSQFDDMVTDMVSYKKKSL